MCIGRFVIFPFGTAGQHCFEQKGTTTSPIMASSAAGFLSRGSSGNNANMRGLVQFIADLRNARARELEEKRINKELANIRLVILLRIASGVVLC